MNKTVIAASLLTLILGTGAGYFFGKRGETTGTAPTVAKERKILYYRNPMGLADTSAVPKKDSMGMDYVPVFADEVGNGGANSPSGAKKILYYRNPMGLSDTSPVPKKDGMGMDYIPVYQGDPGAPGQVQIAVEKIQKLGVRTEVVSKRVLSHIVRAAGTVQIDERRQHVVTTKFEGWIDKLYVNATGQAVKRGETLLQAYSPELLSAQREYLIAAQGQKALQQGEEAARNGVRQLSDASLQRLRNWDISDAQLKHLLSSGQVTRSVPFVSPATGVVMEKAAVEGMRFGPGEILFKIADLSNIWVIAEVYEQDLPMLRVGQPASVRVTSFPGQTFKGNIGFIYPTLNPEVRTARVRIELANNDGLLKPAMFANVEFTGGDNKEAVVAVPNSAVLDSGKRQLVLIQRGEGVFEPREVKLGMRTDGYTEILAGVEPQESVVVSANFLIDAESNLKAALGSFGHSAHGSSGTKQAPAENATVGSTTGGHEGHATKPSTSRHEGH